MNVLLVHRNFNDIDHMAPISYKLLKNGHNVYLFLADVSLNVENDYRLKFLASNGARIFTVIDLFYLDVVKQAIRFVVFFEGSGRYNYYIKRFFLHIIHKINRFKVKSSELFFDKKIDALMFDHMDARNSYSAISDLYDFAIKNNIKTFSLPHGLDITTNYDIYSEEIMKNEKIKMSVYLNQFDYVIINHNIHLKKILNGGVDRKKCYVLGSARFSKEWMEMNSKKTPVYNFQNNSNKKIIVFMPQHSQYRVDVKKEFQLVEKINNLNRYIIYFKPHTRNQNEKHFQKLSYLENVIMANQIPSNVLIDESDAVIVYSSSIVLEAIYREKIILYPKFLHSNVTIFEEFGACELFQDEDSMLQYLKKELNKSYSSNREKKCLNMAVNPNRSADILQDYVDFMINALSD